MIETNLEGLKKMYEEATAFEATWRKFKLFGLEAGLFPDGRCHVYELNCTYNSLDKAVQEMRINALQLYQSGIRTYGNTVAMFDTGKYEYDEFFTEARIKNLRERLALYPLWIDELNKGKFLVHCDTCDKSNFVAAKFEVGIKPPVCIHCGSETCWE